MKIKINKMEKSNDTIQRRQVAIKSDIKTLINSKYVKEEGWLPNYIITSFGDKISRINILAIVTMINVSNDSLIIDDGTSSIHVRFFNEKVNISDIQVSDVVQIIGRPREYNEEKYIALEIIKKTNPKWLEIRKFELKSRKPQEIVIEEASVIEEVVKGNSNKLYDSLLSIIKELDLGEGADFEEVISKSNVDNTEKTINELLTQGMIFEIKKGKLKIL